MLSLKQRMIGLNLYCGGAPAVPPQPAGTEDPHQGAAATAAGHGLWAPSEGPRALIGGGPRAGAPRALIGPLEAAPHSLIGWPLPQPLRPGTLPLPEEELDGCEPDAEAACPSPRLVPSPTGSLPSDDDEDGGRAPQKDALRAETLEVVLRYLLDAAAAEGGPEGPAKTLRGLLARFGPSGGSGAPPPSSARVARTVETLRRVGDDILQKHQLAFQGMLKKLEIKNKEDLKSISEVATHVFSDGITNWGRILTLISFGGFVAKHLKSINQESSIFPLAEIITDVLVKDKREWLVSHNAWEGFVKFFHVDDLEGSIRNVLIGFASFAGIGAGLAYMIR
ncbi:induced myeloid leukemia cell differentiation protein Mcl-1 [Sphaerodactylus townsendi]|uniref:Uncharacterized protein n=1 Tax=Sphaerodactylus townsendi TaxID=933632 RepID=A0ACB8G7D7_9SAUR|nr:induced myeloid leukemia cell differentiation protein Mcl-1 [Sphaerodactylus townsendi]